MKVKADPYGRDRPSPIPDPGAPGRGEYVPPYDPPGIPPYLRPIPVNTRDVLAELRRYLNAKEPKVVRWLYSTWNAEREAIKYQELRNAIRDREMPLEWLLQWQQDYSRFVIDVLGQEWLEAMQTAAQVLGDDISEFAGRPFFFTPTGQRIDEWIQTRSAELITNLFTNQREAIRLVIRQYTVVTPVSPDELGRIIRPLIGLTAKQANAVLRFMEALRDEGLETDKIMHQVSNYAGYLHRYRAITIARTELAFAYNFGQLEAIRQANAAGFFDGQVVKVWMTAHDERVCPHCGPLDGMTVGLEETYPGATAAIPYTYVPPAHPRCRCAVGYRVLRRE